MKGAFHFVLKTSYIANRHSKTSILIEAEAINDYYAGLRILCALVYKIKDEVERWD